MIFIWQAKNSPAFLYIEGLDSDIPNISSWYYGAWTMAVQRLKGWNTWNQNAYKNYNNIKMMLEEKEKELDKLSTESKEFISNVLQVYEKMKDEEIKLNDIEGEYLGWYSKNLTFINYKLIGIQPLYI